MGRSLLLVSVWLRCLFVAAKQRNHGIRLLLTPSTLRYLPGSCLLLIAENLDPVHRYLRLSFSGVWITFSAHLASSRFDSAVPLVKRDGRHQATGSSPSYLFLVPAIKTGQGKAGNTYANKCPCFLDSEMS